MQSMANEYSFDFSAMVGQKLYQTRGAVWLVFACGLLGSTVVPWMFNFVNRRRGRDIAQVIKHVLRRRMP